MSGGSPLTHRLLLAANPELDWLGISVAAGNAPLAFLRPHQPTLF